MVRVDTSKGHLATGGTVSLSQVEPKDSLIDQLLVDQVVEWRNNAQDRDGVVAQSKDTIKLAKGKRQTGLLDRLAKVLALYDSSTDLDIVVADDALERSAAVLDRKLGSIGAEGG